MLRKLYLLPVLAIFAIPAVASAQFQAQDWELTLAGQGTNDKDFRTVDVSVQGSLGYFLTKEFEVSVRQTLSYEQGGSRWVGQTFLAVDYHFDLDRWQPFVGGNIGKGYGDEGNHNPVTGAALDPINDDWFAGPEVGVKYFVNSTTWVGVSAAYEFDLEEGIDTGAFQYNLAIGFRF